MQDPNLNNNQGSPEDGGKQPLIINGREVPEDLASKLTEKNIDMLLRRYDYKNNLPTPQFGGLASAIKSLGVETNDAPKDDKAKDKPTDITPNPDDKKPDDIPPVDTPVDVPPVDTLPEDAPSLKKLVEENKTKFEALEKEYNALKETKSGELTPDVKNRLEVLERFITELKSDFWGTWKKAKGEFGLPEEELIKAQLNSDGKPVNRLQQWQNQYLKGSIEKQFNMLPNEFEYKPEEADMAGTPSYEWRRLTRQKEAEFESEEKDYQLKEVESFNKIKAQQIEDAKQFAKEFFGDENLGQNYLDKIAQLPNEVAAGRLPLSNHPLSTQTILRGVYFKEAIDKAVDTSVRDIISKFAKYGMSLPKGDMPTDLQGTKSADNKDKGLEIKKNSYSPFQRELNKLVS